MRNEQGFSFINVTLSLFSICILLVSSLQLYGTITPQVSQINHEWRVFWEMKKWVLKWREGSISVGYYQENDYQIEVQERWLRPHLKEGEITFRWDKFHMNKKIKMVAYRMDSP